MDCRCAHMVLRTALAHRLEAARSLLHCKAWECRARCPDNDLAALMLQPMAWSCSQGCNGYDIPAVTAGLHWAACTRLGLLAQRGIPLQPASLNLTRSQCVCHYCMLGPS